MEKEIYFTTYGKKEENGNHIIKVKMDIESGKITYLHSIDLDGKANMVIEANDKLITSVKTSDNHLLQFYDKKTLMLVKSYECDYFYSYGQIVGNKIILASYENGVDSIFDLEQEAIVKNVIHLRNDLPVTGRSHYIHKLSDGRVISVDNALQQIYIYKNDELEIEKVVNFELDPIMNIRLLSFSSDEKYAYLNTEKTGEVLVLNVHNFEIIDKYVLSSDNNYFSGGNVISSDGKFVCISMRGEDCIYIFNIKEQGKLEFVCKFKCGKIPRDLKMIHDYLLVSCTEENQIEIYQLQEKILAKLTPLEIFRPITFAMN